MPSTKAGFSRLIAFDRDDLMILWNDITEDNTAPEWAPGKALEYLFLRAFHMESADVAWPYGVTLGSEGAEVVEQIDGAVYVRGLACLIECKDTRGPINVEPIAKLRNQLLRRPGSAIGIVVSRSGFTDSAVTLAQFCAPQTILLWDGEDLELALQEERIVDTLFKKYRFCIERALPIYKTRVEDLS